MPVVVSSGTLYFNTPSKTYNSFLRRYVYDNPNKGIAYCFGDVTTARRSYQNTQSNMRTYYSRFIGAPTFGSLKFSRFYGKEKLLDNSATLNNLVADVTMGKGIISQGHYRHVLSIPNNLGGTVAKFKCHYNWTFTQTKQYDVYVGKGMSSYATQQTKPNFVKHFHHYGLGHRAGRISGVNQTFTAQSANVTTIEKIDFTIRMWGGYHRDGVDSGNTKIYI